MTLQKTPRALPIGEDATPEPALLADIRRLIAEAKAGVATAVNAGLTLLYWRIGKRIRDDVLQGGRAGYGAQIIPGLAARLTEEFGQSFDEKSLRNMLRFADAFPDEEIVSALRRQLSWTHFKRLAYIEDRLKRDFYTEMCRIERWSTRTLDQRIDSMLYERTALSRQPESVIDAELATLRDDDRMSPELVFKDPYLLDFLGLKDRYLEKDLEDAILRELESFILEMGAGFTFVARQKRIQVDGDDFFIDLLFYNRRLRRLVAVDLKLGKFRAADKGQMELYLRWLERHEQEPGEASPLGLILCAEAGHESVELLRLEDAGIRVGQYLTELPPKKVLERKLRDAISASRARLAQLSDEP